MHSSQATLDSDLSALSYADAVESWLGRKIITLSEQLSGRNRYAEWALVPPR